MFRPYMVFVFLLVTLFPQLPVPSAFAAPSAIGQVQETVDEVLVVLGDKTLEESVRREKLRTLIRNRFDFALMSQWTLGVYWRQADAAQQKRFIDLYGELLEKSYLGKIEAYTDEKVNYLGEKIEGQRAQVETEIATTSANIPLVYRLTLDGDKWMVFDVVIEGVSLVRNYRSTFGEIARKEGIDGLLNQLAKKVEEQK